MTSQNQINSCNFMVKGYHYTKPTQPIRTDSCRLFIDDEIENDTAIESKICYTLNVTDDNKYETFSIPINIGKYEEEIFTQMTMGAFLVYVDDTLITSFNNTIWHFTKGTPTSGSNGNITWNYDGNNTLTFSGVPNTLRAQNKIEIKTILENKWVAPSTATIDSASWPIWTRLPLSQDPSDRTGLTYYCNIDSVLINPFVTLTVTGQVLWATDTINYSFKTNQDFNYSGGSNPADGVASLNYNSLNGLLTVVVTNSYFSVSPVVLFEAEEHPELLHMKGIHNFYVKTSN